MIKKRWSTMLLTAALPFVSMQGARAQLHEGDIGVARSAGNQLQRFGFNIGQTVFLPPVSGLLNGWADNDPGFDSLPADDPGNGLFTMQPGAQIRVRATAIDSALNIWAPNLGSRIDAPGEFLTLGNHQLHEHLTWHIDSNDPGFNPVQTTWQVTLQLEDTGTTAYATSQPFVLTFSNQPAPVPTMSEVGVAVLACSLAIFGGWLISRPPPAHAVLMVGGE